MGAIDFIGRGSRAHVGTAFDEGLNVSSCVNCGQCVAVCPTGALAETRAIDEVLAALADPDRVVVVQHAPSVSVSLAEEFGLKPGTDVDGPLVTALRRLGFDWVFDTAFTADLTIMEEASELAHRIANGGTLPMMTSCSPGWIKFVEQFYPDMIPNLSTCKSPQQMLGAVVKTFLAERTTDRPGDDLQRRHHAVHGEEVRSGPAGDGPRRPPGHRRGADDEGTGRADPDARPRPGGAAGRRGGHALRRAHVGGQDLRRVGRRGRSGRPDGAVPARRPAPASRRGSRRCAASTA